MRPNSFPSFSMRLSKLKGSFVLNLNIFWSQFKRVTGLLPQIKQIKKNSNGLMTNAWNCFHEQLRCINIVFPFNTADSTISHRFSLLKNNLVRSKLIISKLKYKIWSREIFESWVLKGESVFLNFTQEIKNES